MLSSMKCNLIANNGNTMSALHQKSLILWAILIMNIKARGGGSTYRKITRFSTFLKFRKSGRARLYFNMVMC
jgi:hypothetical protein